MNYTKTHRTGIALGVALALFAASLVVVGRCTAPKETIPVVFGGPGNNTGTASAGIPTIPITAFGAVCDGTTDDRASIQSAITAACALSPTGAKVLVPERTCAVGEAGSNFYSIQITCDNLELVGTHGKSRIRHVTGLPAKQIAIIFANAHSNLTFRDLVIDGNWGNATTTVADASAGASLPQSTINVASTSGFPTSGTAVIQTVGGEQTFTYTGVTSTSFIGASGGTGTIRFKGFVGRDDSQDGLNQTGGVEPRNFGVQLLGVQYAFFDGVDFTQIFGDCVDLDVKNGDASTYTNHVRFNNITCDMAARNGITASDGVTDVVVENYRATNIFAQAFDSEPNAQPIRNVTIERSFLGSWWAAGNCTRQKNSPLSIGGGALSGYPIQSTAGVGYRVRDSTIEGSIQLTDSVDVVVERNRIIEDWDCYASPPVEVLGANEDYAIKDNEIYLRTQLQAATPSAGVYVSDYLNGTAAYQPSFGIISNNKIHARNGAYGVEVIGPGGSTTYATGTATSASALSVTDSGKSWTTNQWSGFLVQMGGVRAIVASNTATVLTLQPFATENTSTAWQSYLGAYQPTPSAGAYVIYQDNRTPEVIGNEIDGRDDGNGGGGYGIYATAAASGLYAWINGSRLVIRGNHCADVGTDCVRIKSISFAPWVQLAIVDNEGHDDQPTPTLTTMVEFESGVAPNITKLVMRGNQSDGTVANMTAGITSGTGGVWLVNDGLPQQWSGYGSPGMSAPNGSVFQRLDGGAGTTQYIRESGAWDAVATNSAQPPEWQSQLGVLGGTFDPSIQATTSAFAGGVMRMAKLRVYATSFSKVVVCVTQLEVGATHGYVTIYKADGTQTSAMASSTVDALSSFSSGGVSGGTCYRQISLSNSVAVSVGDDVYVAILLTGTPSPTGSLRAGGGLGNFPIQTSGSGVRQGTTGSGLTSVPVSVTLSSMSIPAALDAVYVQ